MGFSQIWVSETFGSLGHPKYREYAADINSTSQHLLSLITDILDVSKVEAGEMKLDESTVDLAALIGNCETLLRNSVTKKDINLQIDVSPQIGEIRADARLLQQILLNLLTNAVKFTATGGHIELKVDMAADRAIKISIADDGCGIREDDLERVLEPFGQVRSHPELSHDGTGLGLPLAKRFNELHGGVMALESIFGEGTRVAVTMPAERTID